MLGRCNRARFCWPVRSRPHAGKRAGPSGGDGALPSLECAARNRCGHAALLVGNVVSPGGKDILHGHGLPGESAEELYENAPCGYLSTTPDGRIVRVNQTFVNLVGIEREQLLAGKRLLDLLTIGGRIFYETHLALMLQMHGDVNEIALDFQRGDGTVVPALVTAFTQAVAAAGVDGRSHSANCRSGETPRYPKATLRCSGPTKILGSSRTRRVTICRSPCVP